MAIKYNVEVLDKIEKELIENLKFYQEENEATKKFLENGESSHHLDYMYANTQGAITVLRDTINLVRKYR